MQLPDVLDFVRIAVSQFLTVARRVLKAFWSSAASNFGWGTRIALLSSTSFVMPVEVMRAIV